MILFLSGFDWGEPKVILHQQKVGRDSRNQPLQSLKATGFGCHVNGCISDVIFLKEL